MIIDTEFNVGDTVFYLQGYTICITTISSISAVSYTHLVMKFLIGMGILLQKERIFHQLVKKLLILFNFVLHVVVIVQPFLLMID